jgi:Fe-S-cluster containining protein
MTDPHQANLAALHAKLDQHFESVATRFAEEMACRAGCSGCCQQSLTLFTVEADRVLGAVDGLDEGARERLLTRAEAALERGLPSGEEPCVLLEDDACVVYEARPTICRSHGAPVQLPKAEGDGRDVCPLNFASGRLPVDAIPSGFVLDLDRVNQTLVAINQLRLGRRDAPARVDITRAIADRLRANLRPEPAAGG